MAEAAAGPSGPGTVVLELGADVGALILYTPADLDGREIEISRDGQPGARRTHSQVRQRHMPHATKYAAVYPDLPAGRYTVWLDEHCLDEHCLDEHCLDEHCLDEHCLDKHCQGTVVTIAGGQITTCVWPG